MTEPKVIAIYMQNEALASLLAMVLANNPGWRVRRFSTIAELELYIRIAPIDLLVCDYEETDKQSLVLVPSLRKKASVTRRDFQVIGLARRISATTRSTSRALGIDEIVIKPMSPRYLEERVEARLAQRRRKVHVDWEGFEKLWANYGRPSELASETGGLPSNVIPLFPNGSELQPLGTS